MTKRKHKTPEPPTPAPAPPPDAPPPPATDTSGEPPAGVARRGGLPDPVVVETVALTGANDGPRVRLLRSNKFQQMRIQFDEKPAEAVRERLQTAGWKWRPEERAWTKQLDRDRRWQTQAEAEVLFRELADEIRAARDLPPVSATHPGRG